MSQHTPTPWEVCEKAPNDAWFEGRTIWCPEEGKRVADTCPLDVRDKANAAFIVRAVNSFYPMLDAIKEAYENLKGEDLPAEGYTTKINALLSSVIAKAEGK